ncbi:WD40 repeat-like protein [Leucogyrophana mollusca]|uniref:WD40 repeat-like protein n=1 Tax=Leucogyrophana mollusca TaxID=85980 RepID=A0ACB8B665_9AGAM|nr:WD40 repeat-like protein [Leucogyrophana mollusca]
MFNNATNVDASHSTFSEVHRDQYNTVKTVTVQGNQSVHTIVHGNQIFNGQNTGLEALQRASAMSAAFDSEARYPAPTCFPGTRVQLLNQIYEWADREDAQPICWLNGLAGTGKSAIAQYVAERFAEQRRLAASFFFSRRQLERSTTRRFFPTIASQLMISNPSLKPAILKVLEDDFTTPTKVMREQMQKLLLIPLNSIKELVCSPIIIVIDSLDECDNDQLVADLISLLVLLLRNCLLPLRILCTSRVEPHIRAKFREVDVLPMTYTLEIGAFDAEEDITSYLKLSFDGILEQRRPSMVGIARPWPTENELGRILKKASGLFIFASTVTKFVGDKHYDPCARLQAILGDDADVNKDSTAYADLDSLYRDALRIFPDADAVRLVIGVIRHISDPLSTQGLNQLLSGLQVNADGVISTLSSVLLVPEDTKQPVRIYHTSFRDFLANPQRSRNYFVDPSVYHRLLVQRCFRLMVQHLHYDVCRIGDSSKLNSDVKDLAERRERYIDEAVRYACRYWSYHLSCVPVNEGLDDGVIDGLKTFSQKAMLHWVEAHSLLGACDSTVLMLRDGISWLKRLFSPPMEIMKLLNDAERLVLMFFEPISQSALQVYQTALPFAPSSTLLRKTYMNYIGKTFSVKIGLLDEWDACRRAIPLKAQVHSLAFSPDGSMFASASDTHGIQLWNSITGINIANLMVDRKPSCAVCFCPSGTYVAAGFECGLVAVWDTLTGQSLISDEGCHDKPITFLCFSPTNHILASASRDASVQLLDATTGNRLQRLDHKGTVQSLVFSSDNRIIVSGCDANQVTVWEVASGLMLRQLKGHTGMIHCVAFSVDNALIASGSADMTVRVWDTRTGVCLRTYSKGHRKAVVSVRFTTDSKYIISVCARSILSWEVSSRSSFELVWSVEVFFRKAMSHFPRWYFKAFRLIHSRLLEYLFDHTEDGLNGRKLLIAFSPGSIPFAFLYGEFAFRATSLDCIAEKTPAFYGTSEQLTALAISPDASRVATANAQGTIEVWEFPQLSRSWSQTTADLTSHNGAMGDVDGFDPSYDGKRHYVKSALSSLLVDENGALIKQLDVGHIASDTSSTWSSDSTMFAVWASSSGHQKLQVFNSSDGRQLHKFGDLERISYVAFSPSCAWIACAHGEGVIQLWDLPSGRRALTIKTQCSLITKIRCSRNVILCGTQEGRVQLWDASTGQLQAALNDYTSRITAAAFSSGGSHIVFGCEDGSIRVWLPSQGTSHLLTTPDAHSPTIFTLAFTGSDATIRCMNINGITTIWRVPASLDCATKDGAATESCEMCCNPDGSGTPLANPNPHLMSQMERGNVYDRHFRSDYVIREDGWIYNGEKRLAWLPAADRPGGARSLAAYNGKLAIRSTAEKLMFIDLTPLEENR